MATKTFKVSLSLDNPRIIQSGINVRSFDKQSIKITIELTKNSQVYQIPTGAQIKISLLKLARQEQKIILDVPFTSADSIDWVVPDYLDGYHGEVRVGIYLILGTENIDVGYFNITSSVSDIDNAAEEFTESVLQGWAIEDLKALLPQFQAVIDETTGKDVISAPEIILARGGATTLGERLDSEKAEVTAQLAEKAKQSELEATGKRIDELIIESGDANAEVSDAHVSTTKNINFPTIGNRFEDIEKNATMVVTNLVSNGNFGNGLTDWGWISANATVENNEATTLASQRGGVIRYQGFNGIANNKYYLSVEIKASSDKVRLVNNDGTTDSILHHTGSNSYEKFTLMFTATTTGINHLVMQIQDARSGNWDNFFVKNAVIVDMTNLFGLGKEPTLYTAKKLMDLPWFKSGNVFQAESLIKRTLSEDNRAISAKNLAINGNFANGTVGWSNVNSTTVVSNKNEASTLSSAPNGTLRYGTFTMVEGHKYYMSVDVKATASSVRLVSNNGSTNTIISHSGNGIYEKMEIVFTAASSGLNIYAMQIQDTRTGGWDAFHVRNAIFIDLSEVFGVGKEPSAEWVEEIMSKKDWSEYIDLFSASFILEKQIEMGAGTTEIKRVTLNDGQVVSLEGFETAAVDMEMGFGTCHFEVSYDNGETYNRLQATSMGTGRTSYRIDVRGQYIIRYVGATHLKYVVDYKVLGHTFKAHLSLSPQGQVDPLPIAIQKQYEPSAPMPIFEVKDINNRQLGDVDPLTNTIYATAGPNIWKSSDDGDSWQAVINDNQPWTLNLVKVAKLSSGRVIAIASNDKSFSEIYTSDVNESNFVLTHTLNNEGSVHPGFGFHHYGDIVLMSPYFQQTRQPEDPLHIHVSKDGGLTWKIIHSAPAIERWHYHDVVYDPYRARIWYCNGDHIDKANVGYSDDFGETWHTLWDDGNAVTQFTSIHPMPDKVVFGLDVPGTQGLYQWLPNSDIIEPIFISTPPGGDGDSTWRGNNYWDAGAIYFTTKIPVGIWGTKNGELAVPFYIDSTGGEFTNVYATPTKIYSRYVTKESQFKLVVADAPSWSEI